MVNDKKAEDIERRAKPLARTASLVPACGCRGSGSSAGGGGDASPSKMKNGGTP